MPAVEANLEKARQIFDTNFFGLVAMVKEFAPLVIASRGKIVNSASTAALVT